MLRNGSNDYRRGLWTAIAALPAALGIIAQLDEFIDLSTMLRRVVVNFDLVIDGLWDLIALHIPVSPFTREFLTTSALLTLPTFTQRALFGGTTPTAGRVIPAIVSIFLIIITVPYYMVGDIFLAIAAAGIVVAFVMRNNNDRWFIYVLFLTLIFVGALIFVMYERGNIENLFYSWVSISLISFSILYVFEGIIAGGRGPTFVVAIAGSIIAIDWINSKGMPALNAWLDSLGAS